MELKPTIQTKFDVYGLGSILVDVTLSVDDKKLNELGVQKGQQIYVSQDVIAKILKTEKERIERTGVGGNVRNTMQGLAHVGCRCANFSIVGSDEFGDLVRENLKQHGITDRLYHRPGMTGICIVGVSPDGEKSMVTFPGDEKSVDVEAISLNDITDSKILYTTAYMLNDAQRYRILQRAIKTALASETLVALDLAEKAVVKQYKINLFELINAGSIDILFGNDVEFKALLGSDHLAQSQALVEKVAIVVVKQGSEGARIYSKDSNIQVQAMKAEVKDTTGAGDLFAAGFLYGLLKSYPVKDCGKIGSLFAKDVVSQYGISLSEDVLEGVR